MQGSTGRMEQHNNESLRRLIWDSEDVVSVPEPNLQMTLAKSQLPAASDAWVTKPTPVRPSQLTITIAEQGSLRGGQHKHLIY